MNSSWKGALALCLCLLITNAANAQLFQRVKSSEAPRTSQRVAKKDSRKNGTAAPTKSQQATAQRRAKVAESQAKVVQKQVKQQKPQTDSAIEQVTYDTFDNQGLEGFSTSEPVAESLPMEGCNCGPTESYCEDGYCGDDCYCDSACGYGCMDCCGAPRSLLDRPGQFFFTADYIYARASFSEALAYVITDSNNPLAGAQFVEFDFDYESSYRFSGGYRLCDCGGEIVFNYARYRSDAEIQVDDDVNTLVQSPYEVNPDDGGTLTGVADVDLHSYDLAISKTIPLGCPLGCCDCCDTCCGDSCCGDTCCDDTCCGDTCCGDSCCGGWCPAWDITWSAGIRFAEVDWNRSTRAVNTVITVPIDNSAITDLSFEGVGARVGVLGRRYFGCNGWLSAYAKGDISVLVGDMDIQTETITGTGAISAISHRNFGRRVIPVTEIEAGLTAHLGRHIHLSSGYFLSAWHDLGMRDTYDFAAAGGLGGFQLSHYDDANILGFDGLFARAEITY